jgi:hypothetical protein
MINFNLFSKVKNDFVTVAISDKLVAHYKKHPEFDKYNQTADHQLQDFWDEFDKILFKQYPEFANEFSVTELLEEIEAF